MPLIRIRIAGAVAVTLLCLSTAWGQVTQTPGGVEATLGDHKPTVPPTPAEFVFPAEPQVVHDPNAKRFTVNQFKLVGNTIFSNLLLQELLEGYLDLQLNLYDLTKAADRITRFYRDNGYAVARAVIPVQRVTNGVVRVEVIEGRIDKVKVTGTKHYSKSLVLAATKDLADGGVVTMDKLERDLLLLSTTCRA